MPRRTCTAPWKGGGQFREFFLFGSRAVGVVPRGLPPGGPAALYKRALWFSVSCCILADRPHLRRRSHHTSCFHARWVVDPGRYPVDGGKSLAEPSAPGKAPIFGLPQFPRYPSDPNSTNIRGGYELEANFDNISDLKANS